MLGVLIFTSLLSMILAGPFFNSNLDPHWENFKVTFSKSYITQEEIYRRTVWEKNAAFIQRHNLDADLGRHTYWLGINQFADMTNEEYVKFLRAFLRSNTTKIQSATHFVAPSHLQLPDEVDWRKEGYVTPVKDQGQCGSCWAFSTTGSLEGQHYKATGKLVSLSEQNLVDCSTKQGNMGCDGGLMEYAFKYIKSNGGIDTEESYPYEAEDGNCRFNAANVGATCTGYTVVPSGDEKALQSAVASVGPISVAIDASSMQFQFYKSGVYNDEDCSSTMLDHGVLAVGYGKLSGKAYWLVKNSWSKTWGDDGYILMSRNRDNQCGIATDASYPLV